MKQFNNEDSRQHQRLDYMREKYLEITQIIENIDKTQPNLKAQAVRDYEEQMQRLNSELVAKDKEMKNINWQLHQAMTRTVDLEPLSMRIYGKYLKYIDDKVKQQMKNSLTPKSMSNPANNNVRLAGTAARPPTFTPVSQPTEG